MDYYAGIDVSLELSSICVVDATGQIVREAKVASEPEALVGFLTRLGLPLTRIGLEAGSFAHGLVPAGVLEVAPDAGSPSAARRPQAAAGQNARYGVQLAWPPAGLWSEGRRDQQGAVRRTCADAGGGSHDVGADRRGDAAGPGGPANGVRQN